MWHQASVKQYSFQEREMHIVKVQISHKNAWNGEQWVTHTFAADELNDVLALLRSLESRNVPYEHYFEE